MSKLLPSAKRHAQGAIDVATDREYRLLPLVLPAALIEATANANPAAGMPFARSLQLDPSAAQLAVPRFDPWLPVTADRDLSIFLTIILRLLRSYLPHRCHSGPHAQPFRVHRA